jgi:hypothetical protein
MSAMSIRLQKDVEHKLTRMGIDLKDLDVLVMHGDVVLTGKFLYRETGLPMSSMDIMRIKQTLYRIPEIESIRCHVLENPSFV